MKEVAQKITKSYKNRMTRSLSKISYMLKKNQELLSPFTFFLLFEFVRRADHLHFLPSISTYNTVLMGKTLFNSFVTEGPII